MQYPQHEEIKLAVTLRLMLPFDGTGSQEKAVTIIVSNLSVFCIQPLMFAIESIDHEAATTLLRMSCRPQRYFQFEGCSILRYLAEYFDGRLIQEVTSLVNPLYFCF